MSTPRSQLQQPSPFVGSPADPILPRGLRPDARVRGAPPPQNLYNEHPSTIPPRAPVQASFGEDQLSMPPRAPGSGDEYSPRRPGVDQPPMSASPQTDEFADITPRAPVVASFSQEQIAHPPALSSSPDTPSPMSMTPRPIGMGMGNGSGRNSPAPANFLPHPNAPVARAPRLLPGAGIGSGVFNPFATPSGQQDDGRLHETIAMIAGRRGMTIRGRTEIDLMSANGPVPMRWNVAAEGDPELEEPLPPMSPISPVRQSPRGAVGVKGPHPLSNSYSAGGGPGMQPFPTTPPRGPGTPSQDPIQRPATAQAQAAWRTGTPPISGAGGPSGSRQPSVDTDKLAPPGVQGPIARSQFTPRVGSQRPRSRSFSGFTGIGRPGDMSG